MSKDYQEQFDVSHEVLEVVDSEGFKVLIGTVEQEIEKVGKDIVRARADMLNAVRDGGVDSEKLVQQLIRFEARLEGLQFIISQVSFFRRKKDEAVKHLKS